MSWEAITVALTIIGLLGALATTMIALFFRVGTFKGSTETRLDHIAEEQSVARTENSDQHRVIFDHLTAHHGRLTAMEERRQRESNG